MKHIIMRIYKDSDKREVIKTGLTLEEAQAHCRDRETSSSTCTNQAGIDRAKEFGPWFDCYQEDRPRRRRSIENLKSPLAVWTD